MNAQHTRLAFTIEVARNEGESGLEPLIIIEHVLIDPSSSMTGRHVPSGEGVAETAGGWLETMNQFEVL